MTAELILVIGGTRSGKSMVAERLAAEPGDTVTYVATGTVTDPEMDHRVAAHRARRPSTWTTVETADVAAAIAEASGTVLVDSVGTWVQARMDAEDLWEDGDLDGIVSEAGSWADGAAGRVVVVAEQVGGGVVATGRGTRRWIDTVGALTQTLSAVADRVVLVVAGRMVDLPAAPVDPAVGPEAAEPGPDGVVPPHSDVVAPHSDNAVAGAGVGASAGERMLAAHGDTMVPAGALDFAVNVWGDRPPAHIRRALGDAAVGRYPNLDETRDVVAGHTGLTRDHVVLLAGAAEAFWLVPHALRPTHAAIVHPTFTAPEAALRACDVRITRVPRDAANGWALRPDRVPDDADLVVLGNPNNPTGTLDEPSAIVSLCRPGRIVLVDEAFMDFVTDNRSSLTGRVDMPGLVVVRSVTKLWAVPGVRAGWLVADPSIAERLRAHQQPWPVSTAALGVISASLSEESWRLDTAAGIARRRTAMVRRLERIPGVTVHDGAANFVLVEVDGGPAVHRALLARGIAVRPSTFPLLPPRCLRVAVRDAAATEQLAQTLEEIL